MPPNFYGFTPPATVPGISRRSMNTCADFFERGMELASTPGTTIVVLGGSWLGMTTRGDYFDVDNSANGTLDFSDEPTLTRILSSLEEQVASLIAQEKQVYIVLNPPGGRLASPERQEKARFDSSGQLQVKTITLAEHLARTNSINTRIKALAERTGGVIIDPADWLCVDGRCKFTDSQGIPYFKDTTHLRASFVRQYITAFDVLLLPEVSATTMQR